MGADRAQPARGPRAGPLLPPGVIPRGAADRAAKPMPGALAAQPQFTFHLKHGAVADLPATAKVIVDPAERRRVLAVFVEEFNHPHTPATPRPGASPADGVGS